MLLKPRRSQHATDQVTSSRAPVQRRSLLLLLSTSCALASCANPSWMAEPRGPRAAVIADLGWLMFGLSTLIYVVVLGLLFVAILHGRRREDTVGNGSTIGKYLIAGGGVIMPAIVLITLLVFTVRAEEELARPAEPVPLTINVIGHQWYWEFQYPDAGVVTIGTLYIPTDEPVRLRLMSEDVIHSFWVPHLTGKMDLIPGQTNELWIEANQPGVYRGQCAEYCGLLHALMEFQTVAEPPAQFTARLEQLRQQPPPAVPPRGSP